MKNSLNKNPRPMDFSGPSSDEATVKLDSVLDDEEIISKFQSMVCIRLENGTPTCSQFSAIYPVILVPSVYFIGDVITLPQPITVLHLYH